MHITAPATSTESLDFSRQAVLRNSCFSRSSGVCFQDFEDKLEVANATPSGDLRRERMEELADRVHFDYHFVPNFLVVQIYGLCPRTWSGNPTTRHAFGPISWTSKTSWQPRLPLGGQIAKG